MKNKIYIAGPMSRIREFNFPAFDEAKTELEKAGWEVISPADLDRAFGMDGAGKTGYEKIDPETFERIVDQDIEAVRKADALFMLRGWEKSKGATAEHALARWVGKKILYQD
jgi:nucleoside 2-deoxyribosyltransferase